MHKETRKEELATRIGKSRISHKIKMAHLRAENASRKAIIGRIVCTKNNKAESKLERVGMRTLLFGEELLIGKIEIDQW